MDMAKVVAIGIVAVMLSVFLKQYNKEYSVLISLSFTILIFLMALPRLGEIVEYASDFFSRTGLNNQYLVTILRIVGISFIAQMGRDLCIDAGQCAIANKIEFFGKILIIAMSLPILFSLFQLIVSVLDTV